MTRRIVQLLSHSIEAHDMMKMYHSLGHEVFDVGGYIDPRNPHDPKRAALPQVPFYPELKAAVDALGTPDNLGAAQERLPDALLEWADTIVAHHYLERVYGQWPRLRDWLRGDPNRRIIWRSVGQSVEGNEEMAKPFRAEGLERVAYSPKEANIPGYSGHDALIRFGKDPDEWCGWTGTEPVVINITQHLRQRDPYTNWGFWEAATKGLNRMPLGPGSEVIGGAGELTLDEMHGWLRKARVYLYTGTQPASYTLGLIEAMMTGIPVVSIGPSHMTVFPFGPDLFEGHEIVGVGSDDPTEAGEMVRSFLEYDDDDLDYEYGAEFRLHSQRQREKAIYLFGIEHVTTEWGRFLG